MGRESERTNINKKRVRGNGSLDRTRNQKPVRSVTAGRQVARTGESVTSAAKKKKKPNWLFICVMVVCLSILAFSTYMIIHYYVQQAAADKGLDDLLDAIGQNSASDDSGFIVTPWTIANGNDSDTTTPIKVVGVDEISLDTISYLDINLSKAVEKTQNADLMGWFYFAGPDSIYGLPVNNALMKTTDNDYYLNHDIYKNSNENGAIYMDYRCYSNLLQNKNTVIYGHARSYRAFGGLKYLNNAKRWYMDANNHFIKVQTGSVNTVWQVFSWYETTDTADYTKVNFSNDKEFINYANKLQDRNQISQLKKFDFTADSRIMTLSTCKGSGNGRVAVHAVLVKSTKA